LTKADSIRLWLVARSSGGPQRAAARLVPAPVAARIEPAVTLNSFDTLEEHVGSVYRYALRLTRRTETAEDLTQETMLRGWRQRHKLRETRVAKVWLLRIATNLWNDELRRAKFRTQLLTEEPPCPRTSLYITSNERENVRLALAAMDELPPRQRQVLYLATCEAMTNYEIADVLAINESAVKSNLSLARKEMRSRLKDIYEEVCGRAARTEL
jgi:RNA polymerase sigma-70 factor, ECF subfamily